MALAMAKMHSLPCERTHKSSPKMAATEDSGFCERDAGAEGGG